MNSIVIDGSANPSYGSDQAFVTFLTVGFQLVSTGDLIDAARALFSAMGAAIRWN